jgi:hypothetical protein
MIVERKVSTTKQNENFPMTLIRRDIAAVKFISIHWITGRICRSKQWVRIRAVAAVRNARKKAVEKREPD